MDNVLREICQDWEGVDYISNGLGTKILFRESGVDFRPPQYICKDFDIIFHRAIGSKNMIFSQDVKILASKIHSSFREIQRVPFTLYVTMKY